ncbi:hypothetical protein [Namhaeicola litoreus]|uniref:SGNH/GDSL hydrolase family protein n=1 Tax=Namhaeicola litoreus TaxID=1052145 RepID=A0ABW3Y4P4_9FLAO
MFLLIWNKYSPKPENLRYRLGSEGHSFTRFKEVKQTKHKDILFVGSSHAYMHFDSNFYEKNGLTSFNLGTNSQTVHQTELLLKRYLDQINPKILIVEVCPYIFNLDGVEAQCDLVSNEIIGWDTLKLTLKLKSLTAFNTFWLAFLREKLFSEKLNFSEPLKNGKFTYHQGGCEERELDFYKKISFEDQKWNEDHKKLKILWRIKQMCSKKNIALVLVQTPVTTDFYNSYKNNDFFDREIGSIAKYYNFNENSTFIDTLHFYDYHHLNQNGVEKFNKEFLNFLRQEKIIK